ncbi:MAG: hypothetical protein IPM64_07245 [Phycisphaerales bacterium]|nr:hypothetical protein [Phycisphaerales bacterium]
MPPVVTIEQRPEPIVYASEVRLKSGGWVVTKHTRLPGIPRDLPSDGHLLTALADMLRGVALALKLCGPVRWTDLAHHPAYIGDPGGEQFQNALHRAAEIVSACGLEATAIDRMMHRTVTAKVASRAAECLLAASRAPAAKRRPPVKRKRRASVDLRPLTDRENEIWNALAANGGNVSATAENLGVSRQRVQAVKRRVADVMRAAGDGSTARSSVRVRGRLRTDAGDDGR